MSIIADELIKRFEPVEPMDFYREIFPDGELDESEEFTKGKYTAIAVEITKEHKSNGKQRVNRYSVCNELDEIDALLHSNNFCVISPISYSGKARLSKNARFMYALCVELDNLIVLKDGTQQGLDELIYEWGDRAHWIPRPTFIVASGNGVHLYYQFVKPIPLFKDVAESIMNYKRRLTTMIWNRHTTTDYTEEKIQQESIFQGFRMVGTNTKSGDKVMAFRCGEPVTIEYMNSYVATQKPSVLMDVVYKSNLTLEQAKEKYPEWYEKRIVNQEPKGTWTVKRDLYDWWLRRIREEAGVGHRYYCAMILSIYAIKCNISEEELTEDLLSLIPSFEEKTKDDSNHFTESDVMDALQAFYDKSLMTYPVRSIVNRSGMPIQKNKRNHRRQELHLKIARSSLAIMGEDRGRALQGRPSKRIIVEQWQLMNPNKSKSDCNRETQIDPKTIRKWWKQQEQER